MVRLYELENEQLRYDEGSKEYLELEQKIKVCRKDMQAAEEIQQLLGNIVDAWKRHSGSAGHTLLSMTVGSDGYASAFALDESGDHVFNYVQLSKEISNEGDN